MKQKEEALHVGIRNPKEVRRGMLEASKNMVQVLQGHERIKRKKHERDAAVSELREVVKEVVSLNNKLKMKFPKSKLATIPESLKAGRKLEKPKIEKPKDEIKKIEKPIKKKPVPHTELSRLESDLEHIESKLKSL